MVKEFLGTKTTDENGVAIFKYTGKGIGKVKFSAKSDNFQSEECEIEDCIYYDPATKDTTGNYWFTSNNLELEHDNENKYININILTSSNRENIQLRKVNREGVTTIKHDNLIQGSIKFSVDIISNGVKVQLITFKKLRTSSNWIMEPLDNFVREDKTYIYTNEFDADYDYAFVIQLANTNAGDVVQFKNFKIVINDEEE